MNIKNRIEKLEDKFNKFVHDTNDELKDLKEKTKEEHPTAYGRMCKIISDVCKMNREIIKFYISKDIERELTRAFPVGCIASYGITIFMGYPVEVDSTCYDTITVTIK